MRETYTITTSKVTRHVFFLVVRHINIITAKYTIIFILDIFTLGLDFYYCQK
jgi:hypothetical protein